MYSLFQFFDLQGSIPSAGSAMSLLIDPSQVLDTKESITPVLVLHTKESIEVKELWAESQR